MIDNNIEKLDKQTTTILTTGNTDIMASSSSSSVIDTTTTTTTTNNTKTATTTYTFPKRRGRRRNKISIRNVLLIFLLIVGGIVVWYDARGFQTVNSATLSNDRMEEQVLLRGPTRTTTTTTTTNSTTATKSPTEPTTATPPQNSTTTKMPEPSTKSTKSAKENEKEASSEELQHNMNKKNNKKNNKKKTQICYNSQGTRSNYIRIKKRLELALNYTTTTTSYNTNNTTNTNEPTYQFVYHAFDRPCPTGCFLHLNNTVPAEGRNAAVFHTVTSPNWYKCKYLVFFDDDVYLLPSSVDKRRYPKTPIQDEEQTILAWRQFHEMLLHDNTTHPLISPQSEHWDREIMIHNGTTTATTATTTTTTTNVDTYQSCVDEVFWAIRYDHVDFVYPMSTIGRDNFWLTNVAMWYVMEKCYPAGVFVDKRWYTKNQGHRYRYRTKQKKSVYKDPTYRIQNMKAMLRRDFGSSSSSSTTTTIQFNVTKHSWLEHSCNIQYEQPLSYSNGVDPKCKTLTEQRFAKWLSGELVP